MYQLTQTEFMISLYISFQTLVKYKTSMKLSLCQVILKGIILKYLQGVKVDIGTKEGNPQVTPYP